MEHSTQTPDYSKETPVALPSVTATRKKITDRIIRDAIAVYHQAERGRAEAEAAFGEDPQLDPVMCIVIDRQLDAERTLVRAILGVGREKGVYRTEKKLWPPCGVRCDGRLYMVVSDPGLAAGMRIGETAEHNENVMVLSVIDLALVGDVGTLADVPVYHPDGARIWHLDDEMDDDQGEAVVEIVPQAPEAEADEDLDDDGPAPRPVAKRVPREEVPRPLLRQSMTIVPPWDNGSDATLEVIVLADGTHLDDVTAGRFDVPELGEAGWIRHSMKGLEVCVRVVG